MKLILANNHSKTFQDFYRELNEHSEEQLDYDAYESLLFRFSGEPGEAAIGVTSVATRRSIGEYEGVYINGYLSTFELAATVAICCDALGIPYINQELSNPPSLSKLTAYAKLSAAGVRIPFTVAGTQAALMQATDADIVGLSFPAVLKRADADRGVDNIKVVSLEDVHDLLRDRHKRTLWVLQNYIENDGFFRVTYYFYEPKYAIFRSLEARPDGNERKAHMYKPRGGVNATLITPENLPEDVIQTTKQAAIALNRQIAGVDCIYDPNLKRTYILEVNYNPQMVTVETFKDIRIDTFIDGMNNLGSKSIDKT